MLRRSPVINRDNNNTANGDKASAESVVDGTIGRGMSEATSMEENENRDDLCSAERFGKLEGSVTGQVKERRRLVDSGEKVSGRVDVVEGENAVDRESVSGNFTVKKLGEVAVEGTVRTTEDFVSKLEIGNEDPCVEWDNSLQRAKK